MILRDLGSDRKNMTKGFAEQVSALCEVFVCKKGEENYFAPKF